MNVAVISSVASLVVLGVVGTAYIHTTFVEDDEFHLSQTQQGAQMTLQLSKIKLRQAQADLAQVNKRISSGKPREGDHALKVALESEIRGYVSDIQELEKLK